ncbi:MAG: SH3 domain-containing protein [Verrucomicrobia bacterium]|nr:SH3 domain-containing protein [Verrucomicrobiota bacterium]
MKTKFFPLVALLASASALAAPLTETTAVHTKPDRASPAVSFLKAGTEPAGVADAIGTTPAGWLAVELPGPFEAYVLNKDLAKNLDVKPGANIYLAPKLDAGVLTVALKDDKVTLTGLQGKWTQIKLERKLTGYIYVGGTAGYVPAIATTPATAAPAPSAPAPAPMSAPPVAPGVYGVATPGHAAPTVNLGDGGASTLARQFAGKFVSTRRPLAPRRPYDWALVDDAGKRYAYLDVSKLLQTEQIENYTNHTVVVFGAAKSVPDTKDIVIQVETLQLK